MVKILPFQKYLDLYFGTIRKLIPRKKEENAIGLDISSSDCKLIEITKSDDKYQLVNWDIEPIGKDGIKSTIQRVLERLASKPKALSTAVFGKGTLIRYIDMPRMMIDDLRKAFNIEADKYFPFTQDQIYTDCYILDDSNKNKPMSIMVAAAKREIIDERVKLLAELGLEVDFIGLNPIALSNVLNVLGGNKGIKEGSAVALLDMGDTVSNLTILINNRPYFTRDIFMGGRELTKQIANALNIDLKAAENMKINPEGKKQEILNICESALMNIIQELRLSFDYFSTERSIEISQMLITGGSSLLDGIDGVFQKNLEVSVGKWDPLANLEVPESIAKDGLFRKESFKMGAALGLALYNYD